MTSLQVENLRVAYPAALPQTPQIDALKGIDLCVQESECVALLGPVGAGKSTLCLALSGAIPHALDCVMEGRVIVCGRDTRTTSMAELALIVGLVPENVGAYLFTATVADEIAFGLESLGLDADEIDRRIAETLADVGLDGLDDRTPQTLSGGEQKRLVLACALAMHPTVLLLDEPTAGLDPRGRRQVIAILDRLRREQGVTVLLATQDIEAAVQLADRAIILDDGHVAFDGPFDALLAQPVALLERGLALPQLAELATELSRRTGRAWTFYRPAEALQALAECARFSKSPTLPCLDDSKTPLIVLDNVTYRYPGTVQPALCGINLQIAQGDWLAVIGVNGSGKSTLLRHLNGLLKPGEGRVWVNGMDTRQHPVGQLARVVSYLPQNPDRQIFAARVYDEVAYGPRQFGLRGPELDERVRATLALLDLTAYAEHPPAVLSYALRRRVALAATLAIGAPVLALDEPDVGLDRRLSEQMMALIAERHRRGTTVVMITHDLRLVARYARWVILLYEGRLVAQGTPAELLADVEMLHRFALDELPVTTLAHQLGIAAPLPVHVADLADRLGIEEAVDG